MEILNKYIIEVYGFDTPHWWNGSKPFVDDIQKAFICPSLESAHNNKRKIDDFYGYECRLVLLEIKT